MWSLRLVAGKARTRALAPRGSFGFWGPLLLKVPELRWIGTDHSNGYQGQRQPGLVSDPPPLSPISL